MDDRPVDRHESRPRMLIAGMHGFIGTHIATAARADDFDVVGLSLANDIDRSPRLHASLGLEGVTAVAGDAVDTEVLRKAITRYQPDVLVNAVGVIRADETSRWVDGYSVNYETAAATVDAIAAIETARRPFVIWIGSQAEYGSSAPPWTEDSKEQPSSAYGASKHLASSLVMSAQRSRIFDGCVVRLPVVFGPGQTPTLLIADAISRAIVGTQLLMTAGEQKRRFAYAPDIARTIVELARRSRSESLPALLNCPASQPTEVRHVIEILGSLMPGKLNVEIGALKYRQSERFEEWPDSSLAESLGLSATTPLEQALGETVSWYLNNRWFVEGTTDE